MLRITIAIALAAGATLALGCNIESGDELSVSTSSITEAGLVEFLADYGVSTLHVLDFDCALRSDSARNIDNYRRGADGVYGTADDRTIDSEAELDSIYMVGPWTITQLYACAETFGYEGNSCEDDWNGEVPPELESEIDAVDDLEDVCDMNLIGHAQFVEIEVTMGSCGPETYELSWAQTIDEEVSVYLHRRYDAEFNLINEDCDI